MHTIQSSLSIYDVEAEIQTNAAIRRETLTDDLIVRSLPINAVPIALDYESMAQPYRFTARLISGDVAYISLDGGLNYMLQLALPGEFIVLQFVSVALEIYFLSDNASNIVYTIEPL